MVQSITTPKSTHASAWENQEAPSIDHKQVYLEARREWNERYGDYIAREHSWKMMCFAMGTISLICAIGMVYIGSQSKFVPYVVEVDKLGSALAVQRADIAARPDKRIIRAQLARWIESVRNVYQDAGAEYANVATAYSMINKLDPAYVKLNEYFDKHNPFKRAKDEGIGVQIVSVIPISSNTWQVQWKEDLHTSKGQPMSNREYQAILTIAVDPPTKEDVLLKNPMGIYVTNYEWSERLEEKK